jgi:hypothetical protein
MLHRRVLPLLVAFIACRPQSPRVAPGATGLTGEITTTVPVSGHGGRAEVELFLPPGVGRVRGVVVFVNRGLDEYAFDNREWRAMCARARCAMARLSLPPQEDSVRPPAQLIRNAAIGGGQALLGALTQLARQTGHPELADAGVLVWGFSAAGSFGPTFATWQPARTLGFIRYHSHMRGVAVDVERIAGIPALFIAGGADSIAGIEDAEQAWRAGRALNAPYAFAIHPRQAHASVDGLLEASVLMRSWIEAVLRTPNSTDSASTGLSRRRTVDLDEGWLGNSITGDIARYAASASGDRAAGSWLPDEATALRWMTLRGTCTAITPAVLSQVLGDGARRTVDRSSVCEYRVPAANGTSSTLWLGLGSFPSVSAAQQAFGEQQRQPGSTPLDGMAGRAFVRMEDSTFVRFETHGPCRIIVAHRATYLIRIERCGPGHDKEAVRGALSELATRLAGRS